MGWVKSFNAAGVVIAAILAVGALNPAVAQQTEPTAATAARTSADLSSADFAQLPNGYAFYRHYPRLALSHDISGRVVLRCAVNDAGLLVDCTVISEDPTGWGFGEATLRLAQEFRVRPQRQDGAKTAGGTMTVPVRWMSRGGQSGSFVTETILVGADGATISRLPHEIWAAQPNPQDLARQRPAQGGSARVVCKVSASGATTACQVLQQTSPEAGAAALRLAPAYRVKRDMPGNRSGVGGTVSFLVGFN